MKKKKNTRQLAFTKPGVISQNNSKYIEFSTTQVFITSKKPANIFSRNATIPILHDSFQ